MHPPATNPATPLPVPLPPPSQNAFPSHHPTGHNSRSLSGAAQIATYDQRVTIGSNISSPFSAGPASSMVSNNTSSNSNRSSYDQRVAASDQRITSNVSNTSSSFSAGPASIISSNINTRSNGDPSLDGITTVSALTLLKRKRKRYESSSAALSVNINDDTGNSDSVGERGCTIRLPPPLYLLLPPAASSSKDSSTLLVQQQNGSAATVTATYASESNLINAAVGIFEIGSGITEIAGQAGTGKTQLCLRLCVSCALSSYVCENKVQQPQPGAAAAGNACSTNSWTMPGNSDPLRNVSEQQAMYSYQQQQQQQQQRQKRPYQPAAHNPYSPMSSYTKQVSSRSSTHPQDRLAPQQQQQSVGHENSYQPHPPPTPPPPTRQNYRAVYITMGEGLTSAQIAYRLGQMASTSTTQSNVANVLNRVLTRSVRNEDEFLDMIKRELPIMLRAGWQQEDESNNNSRIPRQHYYEQHQQRNHSVGVVGGGRIGVVVFDSIAGLFRTPDFAPSQVTETNADKVRTDRTSFFARRSEILFGISAQLRKLSDEYGVAFVVANQATATLSNRVGISSSNGGSTVPALGMSWSNCVNTRYVLKRYESLGSRLGATSSVTAGVAASTSVAATKGPSESGQVPPAAVPSSMFKRWARVTKSPVLPPVSVPFAVEMSGGVAKESPK